MNVSVSDLAIDYYIAMAQRKLSRLVQQKAQFLEAGDEVAVSETEAAIVKAQETLARLELAKNASV